MAVLSALLCCKQAAAQPTGGLARSVPQDSIAAYFVNRPPPAGSPSAEGSSFELVTFLIDQAYSLGLLSRLDLAIRGWLDALAAVSVVLRHPHAVMLLEVEAVEDGHSHRLGRLAGALVMDTHGDHDRIEHRIRHLLASHTNRDETTLEIGEESHGKIHRLRDRRLPDWLVISWASNEGLFIVSVGERSFECVMEVLRGTRPSLADDSWFHAGVERLAAKNALVTVYAGFDVLRREPVLGAQLDRVCRELHIENAQKGLWAVGFDGSSVEIRQWLRRSGRDEAVTIASAEFARDVAAAIPNPVGAYAAVNAKPQQWFERIRHGYLSTRSPRNAEESRSFWRDVESRAGLQISELFSSLDAPIIIHDFPRHAFRLPPAWTLVIPVKGEAHLLRRDIDALMRFWQTELAQGDGARLVQDHEPGAPGWHLYVGMDRPALTVTDRFLVASFSPAAVRQNIDEIQRAPRSAGTSP